MKGRVRLERLFVNGCLQSELRFKVHQIKSTISIFRIDSKATPTRLKVGSVTDAIAAILKVQPQFPRARKTFH